MAGTRRTAQREPSELQERRQACSNVAARQPASGLRDSAEPSAARPRGTAQSRLAGVQPSGHPFLGQCGHRREDVAGRERGRPWRDEAPRDHLRRDPQLPQPRRGRDGHGLPRGREGGLRFPPQREDELPRLPGRRVHSPAADPPPCAPHGRHSGGADPRSARQGPLLRARQRRVGERQDAERGRAYRPLREPRADLSHAPHHPRDDAGRDVDARGRSLHADRLRPARSHRRAAARRQDGPPPEDGERHHEEPPGRRPHRAAHRPRSTRSRSTT